MYFSTWIQSYFFNTYDHYSDPIRVTQIRKGNASKSKAKEILYTLQNKLGIAPCEGLDQSERIKRFHAYQRGALEGACAKCSKCITTGAEPRVLGELVERVY